ncbi:HNH endonuclease [Corynebacterium breve]|uniref:HNH endonuclease n=1 Tax=Corynebacterium breve TaxID=3049799 RepID=A0ABY8VGS3_9CORY|nr:HNH endonuclease [Corynebacterium breve]WIM67975.1 HNH endonuclease [Corynebacterium breve]
MTAFETFAASWADAISILDGAFGATAGDLVEAGLDSRMARKVVRLAGVYFGPTHAGKKQAQACRSARENRHTFNTLGEIETFVGRLKNKAHAWAMRKALCKEPANLKRINERGKELLSEFNGPEQPANKASLRATAIPDSTYMHFRACAPGHLVKAAMDALTEHASEEHPAERAMKILAGGGNPAGPAVVPAVIISIDDAGALITAEGDEVILSLTNGTRMLGADFIRNALADYGYAMLVDPVRGPINVYRTSRFATKKNNA